MLPTQPVDVDVDVEVDVEVDDEETAVLRSTDTRQAGNRRKRRMGQTARWSRLLHVYTSMISLLVVLFFGLTGVTLNHPTWTFGQSPTKDTYTGTLPTGWYANGNVDFLNISEFVRNHYDVKGEVGDYNASATDGSISFKAPGYAADVVFTVPAGVYTVTIEQQGILAVLNDIHKGRDTDSSWHWVIDLSGGLLVVVAVTGLGIQVFQRKRRRIALIVAGVSTVVTLIMIYIALR